MREFKHSSALGQLIALAQVVEWFAIHCGLCGLHQQPDFFKKIYQIFSLTHHLMPGAKVSDRFPSLFFFHETSGSITGTLHVKCHYITSTARYVILLLSGVFKTWNAGHVTAEVWYRKGCSAFFRPCSMNVSSSGVADYWRL